MYKEFEFYPRSVRVGLAISELQENRIFSQYFSFPLSIKFRQRHIILASNSVVKQHI